MGSRHNRKRTRSRPRNRPSKSQFPSHSSTYENLSLPSSPITPFSGKPSNIPHRSTAHGHQLYSSWQARLRHQARLQEQHDQVVKEEQANRLRVVFGGVEDDGMALCAPMLQVVMDLFEGSVDYVDP